MSARRGATLTRFAPPDEETLRFNDALERLLLQAPPPGAIPVEDIRALRAAGKGVFPLGGPLAEGRWRPFDGAAYGSPAGPGRVRVITPAHPRGVLVHFHGGGWTFGAAELEDHRNLRIAKTADVAVISVPYRLAPEHRWPACAEDAAAGARFALDLAAEIATAHGRDPDEFPIFLGGESAGAHLAAVTLTTLRDERRLDRIAGAVLTYGCFDLRMTPSLRNWGARNLILSTPIVDWFIGNLLGEYRALAERPEVSPLLADLSGMPPAFFQVGTEDPLLDDTTFMAERWRAAGDGAEIVFWPGGVHGFDYFDRPEQNLPIAGESYAAAARWLKDRIAEL